MLITHAPNETLLMLTVFVRWEGSFVECGVKGVLVAICGKGLHVQGAISDATSIIATP